MTHVLITMLSIRDVICISVKVYVCVIPGLSKHVRGEFTSHCHIYKPRLEKHLFGFSDQVPVQLHGQPRDLEIKIWVWQVALGFGHKMAAIRLR